MSVERKWLFRLCRQKSTAPNRVARKLGQEEVGDAPLICSMGPVAGPRGRRDRSGTISCIFDTHRVDTPFLRIIDDFRLVSPRELIIAA